MKRPVKIDGEAPLLGRWSHSRRAVVKLPLRLATSLFSQRRGAYKPQFRQQMVDLFDIDRKPLALAKELGDHETRICAKSRRAQAEALGCGKPEAPLTTAERQVLAPLRRQERQITQERDILAKAREPL